MGNCPNTAAEEQLVFVVKGSLHLICEPEISTLIPIKAFLLFLYCFLTEELPNWPKTQNHKGVELSTNDERNPFLFKFDNF